MAYGLKHFLSVEGYDSVNSMCAQMGIDPDPGTPNSVCTACGMTCEMEPDQDRGYCDDCDKNTVKSVYILMGIM